MPSTPTTKSQVQAYQFVLRRMQSALVRKDAVMLHDPMRTHSRATIVGVCLAAIGMVGFIIWGLFDPEPSLPSEGGIVIAQPSGQVYVVSGDPKTLTPTFNLASARLWLLAQDQKQNQGGAAGPSSGGLKGGEPTVIKDDQLKDVKKNRLTGIPYGPTLLPSDSQRPSDNWAVCDETQVNRDLPVGNPGRANRIQTTVLAGVTNLGQEFGSNQALLVTAENERSYLVYRTPSTANSPAANAVKAEVDLDDAQVVSALDLSRSTPRTISSGLLNAIPEVRGLSVPQIDGANQASNAGVEDFPVGQVFSVERAGKGQTYYVVLQNGIQEIKQSTANLLRFANTVGGGEIRKVREDVISPVQRVNGFDESTYPDVVPDVLEPDSDSNSATACLGWTVTGQEGNQKPKTQLFVGLTVPEKDRLVQMSTPSPDGERIDFFYMTPGRAAVVRGASSENAFGTGPLYLISDLGVKFGIPDSSTAEALGLGAQRPAPDAIVSLLPNGASLNTRDVQQSFDTVPQPRGQFPGAGQ